MPDFTLSIFILQAQSQTLEHNLLLVRKHWVIQCRLVDVQTVFDIENEGSLIARDGRAETAQAVAIYS